MSEKRMTQHEFRALALSLPEAQADSHMGRPDLRVRKKIFATLPEDGLSVNLKTTPIGLDMLVREDPDAFRDVWGGRWVGVTLERVAARDLEELLVEAYCLAAPRKLAALARERLKPAGDSRSATDDG